MSTTYFDSFAGPVPVKLLGRKNKYYLNVKVTKKTGCYVFGEILTIGSRYFVQKVGNNKCCTLFVAT